MRVVLFDYDGTLNDSLEANFDAFQGVAREFNLPSINLQQFLGWYTPNWYVVYEKMGVPVGSWKKADEIWLRYYDRRKARLFPDSIQTLKRLKLMGCRVGLVTGGTRNRVEKELKILGIDDLFDVVIYGSDVTVEDLKPSPTQIEMALEHLEEKPRETLYVGDTAGDVLAGKKAGATTVATTRGFNSKRRLRQAKPDFVIHNLTELLKIIEEHHPDDPPQAPSAENGVFRTNFVQRRFRTVNRVSNTAEALLGYPSVTFSTHCFLFSFFSVLWSDRLGLGSGLKQLLCRGWYRHVSLDVG